MIITDGETLEETVNIQVVRLRDGNLFVQHMGTEQIVKLESAVNKTAVWHGFIPNDDDNAAIQRCAELLKQEKPAPRKAVRRTKKATRAVAFNIDEFIPRDVTFPQTPQH